VLFHHLLDAGRKYVRTSGKFISFPQTRRCYIPEDSHIQIKLVASQTFSDACINMEGDRNCFCATLFQCHGNSSPDEILSVGLTQESWEVRP
jgi:hypothetical protein